MPAKKVRKRLKLVPPHSHSSVELGCFTSPMPPYLESIPYDSQTKTASMPQPVAYQLVDPLLESMAAQSALADFEGCEAYHALNRPA